MSEFRLSERFRPNVACPNVATLPHCSVVLAAVVSPQGAALTR